MGTKDAVARLRADDRKLTPDLRRARAKYKKFSKGVTRDMKASFTKVKGVLGTVAGLGGVIGFAALGRDVLNFESKLKRLEIQAGKSDFSMDEFRIRVTEVSNATGQSRAAILEAAEDFVAFTGDTKGAVAAVELFAEVATASGATILDVSKTAQSLQENLRIKPEAFEEAFSALVTQGKQGAIELRNLAGLLSSVAPSFSNFSSKGVAGLRELGAAFQTVRKEFGSPEEAATGLRAIFVALRRRAKVFEGAGVKIFDVDAEGNKTLRNFKDIVQAIGNSKLMKDPTALTDAFGRQEATRAFEALTRVEGAWDGFIEKSQDATVIQRDFADFATSSAGKMAQAWERVKNQFAKILTPERIGKLANAFIKVADALPSIVGNLETIAAIFVAMKSIGFAASIGSAAAAAGKAATAASLGFGAMAVGLGAALVAGLALGKALDDVLGISDKISELAETRSVKTQTSSGFLRDTAEKLNIAVRSGAKAGVELTPAQRSAAVGLARSAREQDIIGEQGNITATTERLARFFQESRGGGTKGLLEAQRRDVPEFKEALKFAFEEDRRLRAVSDKANEEIIQRGPFDLNFNFDFNVDQNGLINLENPKVLRDRRGATP